MIYLLACRIVGPAAKAEFVRTNGLLDALQEAFRRLNKIAGLKIQFYHTADTEPAAGSTGKKAARYSTHALVTGRVRFWLSIIASDSQAACSKWTIQSSAEHVLPIVARLAEVSSVSADDDGAVVRASGFTETESGFVEDYSLFNGIVLVIRTGRQCNICLNVVVQVVVLPVLQRAIGAAVHKLSSVLSGHTITICAGVDRDTTFPDIGAQEWTYNRMLETILKSNMTFFETRILITHLTLVPEGLHVLKYIPMRPHYADETILQASPPALPRALVPQDGLSMMHEATQLLHVRIVSMRFDFSYCLQCCVQAHVGLIL